MLGDFMKDDTMKNTIPPDELHIMNEEQWAERVEKILLRWLNGQPYSTKLTFVLLDGCRLADKHTQAVFHEISRKYKAEVIDSAEELPDTLDNTEVFLTGVAADMLHSEERVFGPPGKDESNKGEKPVSKSSENSSGQSPLEMTENEENISEQVQ
jgi:hypothetical protein